MAIKRPAQAITKIKIQPKVALIATIATVCLVGISLIGYSILFGAVRSVNVWYNGNFMPTEYEAYGNDPNCVISRTLNANSTNIHFNNTPGGCIVTQPQIEIIINNDACLNYVNAVCAIPFTAFNIKTMWTGSEIDAQVDDTPLYDNYGTVIVQFKWPKIGTLPRVTPSTAVSVYLAANPSSVIVGNATRLFYSTINATVCKGSWSDNNLSAAPTGLWSGDLRPLASTVYTIFCTDGRTSDAKSVYVEVTDPPSPAVTFSADPPTLYPGQSTILSWQATNAVGCVADPAAGTDWMGVASAPISGAVTVSPPPAVGTVTYRITCYGAYSRITTANTIVTVVTSIPAPPTPIPSYVAINPSAPVINAGGSSDLLWSVSHVSPFANPCRYYPNASNFSVYQTLAAVSSGYGSGAIRVNPAASQRYRISCVPATGGTAYSVSAEAVVYVNPADTCTNPALTLAAKAASGCPITACPAPWREWGIFCCQPDPYAALQRFPDIEVLGVKTGKKYCSPQQSACQSSTPQFCANTRNTCCPAASTGWQCGKSSIYGLPVAICIPPRNTDGSCPIDTTECGATDIENKKVCCPNANMACAPMDLSVGVPFCQPKDASACLSGTELCQGSEESKLNAPDGTKKRLQTCCPQGTCRHHKNGAPYCQTTTAY